MSGNYLLIEATEFTVRVKSYFGDESAYAEFQSQLAEQPDRGQSYLVHRLCESFGEVMPDVGWGNEAG